MRRIDRFFGFCVASLLVCAPVLPQETSTRTTGRDLTADHLITFNGTLKDNSGLPRLGNFGITFSLYSSQESATALWQESQSVQTDEHGRYTVLLGATEKEGLPLGIFSGGRAQWLGVQVQGEEEQSRVFLVAVPYALKAADADTVGGRPASSFVLNEDLVKAQQAGNSLMVITESGSASVAGRQASEQKMIQGFQAGGPVLATSGSAGAMYAGNGGSGRLYANEGDAKNNTYYGSGAGGALTTGSTNAFFGVSAGTANTEGSANAFFGFGAGSANTTGNSNSIFGWEAGFSNTLGISNSFFGEEAGRWNSTGAYNSFFGQQAGFSNLTGNSNSVFGYFAGSSNDTGSNNTFLGAYADSTAGLTNATAVGYRAKATQSNSLILGSINGVNGAAASTNVGIGTTSPGAKLDVIGAYGLPGASIPAGWANRVTGRRGVVRGNRGFYEDIFEGPSGFYAELSTYKWDDGTPLPLAFNANGGNIGIGTATPGATLDVIGLYGPPGSSIPPGWANRVTGRRGVVNGNRGFYEDIIVGPNTYAELSTYKWDDGTTFPLVFNANGGNVGIGTTNPTERLQVVGNLKVSGNIIYGTPEEPVPDYVFESSYRLMPIGELHKYVLKEKHLPNVPNAGEIKEKGLNLGDFQMKMLGKIEELTLYAVQQSEAISVKDAKITALEEKNQRLEARLAALERMMGRLIRQEEKR